MAQGERRAAPSGLDGIRARVRAYADEAGAQHVIVLDMSGHVLAAAGTVMHGDDVALGALLAGLFGSAKAMSAMLGEPDFRSFFQQGVHTNIYTVLLGEHWLLVTVFDHQTQVGLVRMLANQAASDLEDALLPLDEMDFASVRAAVQTQAFRTSFDDTLERLFQDDPNPTHEER